MEKPDPDNFDWEKDKRDYEESEGVIESMGSFLDRSREERVIRQIPEGEYAERIMDRLKDVEPFQMDVTAHTEPYHHETQSAYGSHGAWQDWYIEHSNCGGTWVYVKDPCNPRVQCSCSMGMGGNEGEMG